MSQKVLRQAAWAAGANYIEFFLGLVITVLITRSLGPEVYGEYSYYLWLSALCIILINSGISTSAIKYMAEVRGDNNHNLVEQIYRYAKKLQIRKIILLLPLSLIAAYFFEDSGKLTRSDLFIIYGAVAVGVLFKSLHMFLVGVAKGIEQFSALARIVAIVSPLNVLAVLILAYFQVGLLGYLQLYAAVSALYFFVSRSTLRKFDILKRSDGAELEQSFKKRIDSHIVNVGAIAALGFVVNRQSELLFMKYFCDSAAMGYFNVAFTLGTTAVSLVPGIIDMVLLPMISREMRAGVNMAAMRVRNTVRILVYLNAVIVIPAVFYATEIIQFLYGTKYLDAVWPLRAMLVIAALNTFSSGAVAYMVGSDRHVALLRITVAFTAVKIVLDYWLVSALGLDGAIYAFGISTLLMGAAFVYYAFRELVVGWQHALYLRTLLVAMIAVAPLFVLRGVLTGLPAAVVGSAVYIGVFLILIIYCKCLDAADAATVLKIKQKVLGTKLSGFDSSIQRLYQL